MPLKRKSKYSSQKINEGIDELSDYVLSVLQKDVSVLEDHVSRKNIVLERH